MNDRWKNRPDIDPDYDPKEIVENYYKKYTYEELFDLSRELTDEEKTKFNKWKKLGISSYESYEQIFYDIANSKQARKLYLKTSIISSIVCLIKLLPFFYFVFVVYGLITSMFTFFLVNLDIWKLLSLPSMATILFIMFIDNLFVDYIPVGDTGKIDRSYAGNKTSHAEPNPSIFGYIWFKFKKQKFDYRYCRYLAENEKEYLIDVQQNEGRYYSIRNWYLIAKYITLGKMKISDLEPHFEDELFFYTAKNNYKEEKIKLRSIFNKNFSLNFMPKFDGLFYIIYCLIIPIVLGILDVSLW